MEVIERLLTLPIVAGVSQADLQALLERSPPRQVAAETLLMDVGDIGEDLVLVVTGGFAVELGEADNTLPLAFVSAGEILGEAALFRRGAVRTARVRAVEDAVVVHMDHHLLDRLSREGNGVALAIEVAVMRTLARRIHDSVEAIDGVLSSAMELSEPKGAIARLRELFRR